MKSLSKTPCVLSFILLRDTFPTILASGCILPDGVPAAKKYGSWDYAYHDVAIVYAKHPYWIVCMTDQGDENVDFPEEPTQAMQTLGQLVYEYWNP